MSGGVPDDSGQKALIGYLFQIIDTATLAYPVTAAQNDFVNGIRFRAIVTTEALAEDAVLQHARGGNVVTEVVQYKFSSEPNNPNNRIGLPEMYMVCMKLHEAIQRLEPKRRDDAVPVLITNRCLIDAVKKMLEDAKAGRGDQNSDIANTFETKRKGKSALYPGRTAKRNKEYLSLLEKIDFRQRDFLDTEKTLTRIAAEYGILEDELPTASKRVTAEIAKLATATSTSFRSFDLKMLLQWMSGEVDCHSLLEDGPLKVIKEQQKRFSSRQVLPSVLVARDSLIRECISSSEPIIHICGQGGTGKSAVLAMLMRSIDATPPFCAVESAFGLPAKWPALVVSSLRNVRAAGFHDEHSFRACSRLSGASRPGSLNQLLLLVDGYDERRGPESNNELRQVVDFVLNEFHSGYSKSKLPVRLVITGRDEKEFVRWFVRDGGIASDVSGVKALQLDSFDTMEIDDLPLNFMDSTVTNMIKEAANVYQAKTTGNPSPEDRQTKTSISRDLFHALLHPAVLGCLKVLADRDSGIAIQALEGKDAGLKALGQLYIDWFAEKVEKRQQQIRFSLAKRGVAEVWRLRQGANEKYTRNKDWFGLNVQSAAVSSILELLYDEALSAGIIVPESGSKPSWKWRSPLVCLGLQSVCEAEGIST